MIHIYLIILFFILLLLVINFNKNQNIEKFTGLLDILSFNNSSDIINDKKNISDLKIDESNIVTNDYSKNIKYIYLKKINKQNKYIFYNKNNDMYLTLIINNNNYEKNIIIKDLQNNIIGNLINNIYNKIIIKNSLYKNNINLEFSDNFQTIKIYLTNDNLYFNIKKKDDNNYLINIFMKNIGKIKYDKNDDLYKVMVYDEYKIYLNLISIGFILLINN